VNVAGLTEGADWRNAADVSQRQAVFVAILNTRQLPAQSGSLPFLRSRLSRNTAFSRDFSQFQEKACNSGRNG
jgi:hypothetical protein